MFLTNISPAKKPPVRNETTLCGRWVGEAPPGMRMFVACATNLPRARYVVLFGQYTNESLDICELEVVAKGVYIVVYGLSD